MDVIYPRIRYQGVPRAPLESILQNPGYIWVKVDNADAERALGEGWHDMPGDAIASVQKGAKMTADQYALVSAQAVLRGAAPPERPKFEEVAAAAPSSHTAHGNAPAEPAGTPIGESATQQRTEGEWPRETERRRR